MALAAVSSSRLLQHGGARISASMFAPSSATRDRSCDKAIHDTPARRPGCGATRAPMPLTFMHLRDARLTSQPKLSFLRKSACFLAQWRMLPLCAECHRYSSLSSAPATAWPAGKRRLVTEPRRVREPLQTQRNPKLNGLPRPPPYHPN